MARWIKLKKRALEHSEWINLDNAIGVRQDIQLEIIYVLYSGQEIKVSKKDDPDAYGHIIKDLTETPPFR